MNFILFTNLWIGELLATIFQVTFFELKSINKFLLSLLVPELRNLSIFTFFCLKMCSSI